jgi:CRP-like cAMP-binding protein
MIFELVKKIIEENKESEILKKTIQEINVPPKTILLEDGQISKKMYFIKKGCLRLWFNHDGKDITFQFFFENQAVSSIESFLSNKPSMFYIETIEHSNLIVIEKGGFEYFKENYPEFKEAFTQRIFERMSHYSKLFLSRIRDTPKERYINLLKEHPEIIQRVPQYYIASYVGVAPESLSRIRGQI